MVTSGTNEIKLVLTVDRADIERQLSKGFDASIGKPPAGGGGGGKGGAKGKPAKVDPGKNFMSVLKPLAAIFGIGLTLQGILKTSKIMQTTASALGAILGAMVDMLLMPFMPLIVDMLQGLINLLPKINQWSQDHLVPAITHLRESMSAWWDEFGPEIINIATTLWDILGPIAGIAWEGFLTGLEELIRLTSQVASDISALLDWIGNIKLPGWMTRPNSEGHAFAAEGSGSMFGPAKDYESNVPKIQDIVVAAFKGIQNNINIAIDKDGNAKVEGGSKNGSVAVQQNDRFLPGSPP